MAESPRTAQNVDYIMRDAEDIRCYLKDLVEKEGDVEAKNAQRELLGAIYRLTTAVENLQLTYHTISQRLAESSRGNNNGQPPAPAPVHRLLGRATRT